MADQVLEGLTEQVLRPLSGDVGEDLGQTSSIELIQIRNQFNDSSRDFRLLYENGRTILAEKSKDLWAAWALVGGLLWSKQFDSTEAFATSCKIVQGLCEKYWHRIYPESRGLRSTLLMQIAKWWNTFAVRCTEGADPAALKAGHDALVALQQYLLSVTDGNTDHDKARVLPALSTLPTIIGTLAKFLDASVSASASPSTGEQQSAVATATSENGHPSRESSSATSAQEESSPAPRIVDSLEKAFEKACEKIRSGSVEEALTGFQATLRNHGEFASQFRGRVFLGELYLRAGLPTHAKRVLQYTHDEIEKIRLADWDPKLCSRLWSNLIQSHQKAKDEKPNDKLLADLFTNLCRIDPSTAASLEPIKTN